MPEKRQLFIERAKAYFADVDRFDTDAILSHLTGDVVLEVPTDGVLKEGIDAVRETYVNRDAVIKKSWHGDFEFIADEADSRLAVRLAVRRTTTDGRYAEMDNLTLLSFRDDKIAHICVWMSGENSLT